MQILAIDTASPTPSVTLLARGGVWEEVLPPDRRASEELLPAIERCLRSAGATLSSCDRIAVCSGPGSFTGLRVGLATAWALGRATGVPIETVPTLEVLAETARYREPSRGQAPEGPAAASVFAPEGQASACTPSSSSRVAGVLDAGRGDVVLAVYSLDGARARIEDAPERLPIAEALRRVTNVPTVALPSDLLGPETPPATLSPSRALALAVARAPGAALSRLEGIYSRPSAAEEKHGAA
jgi:tRNA threonylcarbamoyl adenosine modification protein YeaZ